MISLLHSYLKNISILPTMFSNRYNSLSTSHYGLLLAGLLLRPVFALHAALLLRPAR